MGHLSETMERIRAERIAKRSFPNNIDNLNKKSESADNGKNSGSNLEKTKDVNIPEDISEIDRLLV